MLDGPLHNCGVFSAGGTPLRDVVFVAIGLVDNFFGDDLLDDVFEGDDANGAAFDTRGAAQEEQMCTPGLAEGCGTGVVRRA